MSIILAEIIPRGPDKLRFVSSAVAASVLFIMCACSTEEVDPVAQEPIPADESTPSISTRLSQDTAISSAILEAGHIIQDGRVIQSKAEPMLYPSADKVMPGATRSHPIPADKAVWLVTLKGLFYEPPGPPPVPGLIDEAPRVPVCSVMKIMVDDDTGEEIRLTLEAAFDC